MKRYVLLENSRFSLNPPGGEVVFKTPGGTPSTMPLLKASEVDERIPYTYLNPLQTLFYTTYEGGNALVSAPTSAGKSLIAFMFLKNRKGNKVFVAPTRSLVYEKAKELRTLFGRKVEVRTGEVIELFKSTKSDVIVATYESLALALRNRAPWIEETEGIVIDEVHQLMGSRGWVLEEIITFLLERGIEVLGLSATLPGAEELAKWIRAELFIESRWRPVPLERKVIPLTRFPEFTKLEDPSQDERVANKLLGALYSLKRPDEQVILFVHKKSVGWSILEIATREKIGVMNRTTPFEKEEREPYEIAFHNADVPKEEREEIEKAFREGRLPVLVATSTLAYGVNLPADTVIISVRAFFDREERKWKVFPDLLDILQMEGRAGRLGIKEKGHSYILPYGMREENLKKELEERMKEEFRPYLKEVLLSREKLRVLSLFILIGYLYEGENFRKFLERTYSLRELAWAPAVEEVYQWLKDKGYIEEGRLSEKALFCVRSGMPPVNYEEFLRRKNAGAESGIWVRPLLFVKKFDGLYEFVKRGESFEEDRHYVLQKLLPYGRECLEDNTDQFLFYLEGLTFKYRNLQNPPGEFSYLGTDALHLVRTLLEIRRVGDIELNLSGILEIAHSVKYGVSGEFSSLGGLKGIGHMRANLLKRLLQEEGLRPPPLGAPVGELISLLRENFGEGLTDALVEVLLRDRYRDESYRDRALREARRVVGVLRGNEGGLLVDDRILRATGLFLLGEKALRMGKRELAEKLLRKEELLL